MTVQKQKLIILEIRQTKSLTDGLLDYKTDGLPDNKTVDKTLAAIEFRSVIQFDEGVQFNSVQGWMTSKDGTFNVQWY